MKKLIYTLVFMMFALNISAQTSWISQYSPFADTNLGKIQFVSATEGWISATNGKLLHTTNSGNSWLPVRLDPFLEYFALSDPDVSMCFINSSTGWVIRSIGSIGNANGAALFKTINGGINWTKLIIPSYDFGFYVQFVDANTGWMSLANSTFTVFGFFRSTNGGINWSAITIPPVVGIPFFINSNTGWLMPVVPGSSGTTSDTIRKTTNGGLSWTAPWGTNNQVYLSIINFSDVNNGWIAGHSGVVLKTTNGGTNWNYVTNTGQTSSYQTHAGYFLNANTGWIGTKNEITNVSSVLYTNNGGVSWTWQTPPIGTFSNSGINGIHFYDALNGGLSGREGIICHTTNGGVWVKNISSEIPSSYSLSQNYPNPFNPATNIRFDLPKSGSVKLVVFDALGREVATLVNEKLQTGTYEVDWDGSNYSSGVYFYKLMTGDYVETKKMLLVK
ncbi:MAG: T9SS type A sorting domain-containing protein [Ignavibacteria bacterium]|nr:T9SS type A sorting domain-containing protein [Ignavibacteria bacterium]